MAVIISLFSVFISFRRNRGQMVQLAFELQWTKLLWVFDFLCTAYLFLKVYVNDSYKSYV